MQTIPYGRQDVTSEDVAEVVACLKSDWLTQGPNVGRFEGALAARCGAHHAIATSSATAALHIACVALGLGPGDWLWTSPNTFVASANAALYCGAQVDFVDIELATGNLCADALEAKLRVAAKKGRLPKVIIPVHFAGLPCDMQRIHALANAYSIRIIEDASHAVGAAYGASPIGSGAFSDLTVFSFHPVKLITSGEGGAVLTNDQQLADRLRRLRSHGMTKDPALMRAPPAGAWDYEAIELGWNYRMPDINAALGFKQLERLGDYLAVRDDLARKYDVALAHLGLTLPKRIANRRSAWHLYCVGWNADASGLTRKQAFEALQAAGIGVQVHYIPVHTQPLFAKMGFRWGDFPAAEKHYARAITLPLFPRLTTAQQTYVIEQVSKLCGQ